MALVAQPNVELLDAVARQAPAIRRIMARIPNWQLNTLMQMYTNPNEVIRRVTGVFDRMGGQRFIEGIKYLLPQFADDYKDPKYGPKGPREHPYELKPASQDAGSQDPSQFKSGMHSYSMPTGYHDGGVISRRKRRRGKSSRLKKIIRAEIKKSQASRHRFHNEIYSYGQHSHQDNECAYTFFSICSTSDLDSYWARVDMLDVLTNTGGTAFAPFEETEVNFTSIPGIKLQTLKVEKSQKFRNNTLMPVYLEYWILGYKYSSAAAFTPVEAITAGLLDKKLDHAISDGPEEGIEKFWVSPFQSDVFKAMYSKKFHQLVLLDPGDEIVVPLSEYSFEYIPEVIDASITYGGAATYIPGLTTFALIRTYGPVAHDGTTETIVGRAGGILDYEEREAWTLGTADFGKYETWDDNVTDAGHKSVFQALGAAVVADKNTTVGNETDGDP